MLVKLAWRNLWRQRRRTLLTASALALALFLSLMTRSFQEGSYSANIENAARFYTGLIQLQYREFYTSQSIDDVMPHNDAFIDFAIQHENVAQVLPRIESVALAAAGERSKGVLVLGVEPEKEDAYSNISAKITAGEYFSSTGSLAVVGEGLADYLKIEVGDELILYGQGYRGQTAAGLYTISGIVHFPLQQLDNQLVYLPLAEAQNLYSTPDLVTNWVLDVHNFQNLDQTVLELSEHYAPDIEVKDWRELSPELAQQILMDKAGGIFLVYVLYGIVGFGLFATILMMTLERQREFAVMLATGMLRSKLSLLLLIESAFISTLGSIGGLVISVPVMSYFYIHPLELTGDAAELMIESGFEPIIPISTDPQLIINQVAIVLVLMCLCLIYPLVRVARLKISNALKGGAHAG